jgi:hypothetical protein
VTRMCPEEADLSSVEMRVREMNYRVMNNQGCWSQRKSIDHPRKTDLKEDSTKTSLFIFRVIFNFYY